MKLLLAIITLALGACIHLRTCIAVGVGLMLCGCSTTITHSNGTPWVKSYSNIKHLEAHSGNESIVIDGMSNSVPTRAAGAIIGTVAADAASAFIPGGPVAKAAVAGAPVVSGFLSKPGD